MCLQCLPLTNHVYDILEEKMIQLLGALYSSQPAYTLEELVSGKAAPLILLREIL